MLSEMSMCKCKNWVPAVAAGVMMAVPVVRPAEMPAPVEVIDEVVVPVPREVFAALDSLGEVNWAGQVRHPEYAAAANRSATALVFGVVIADGFVAVQAKDAEAARKLGPQVLDLADLLGVKDAVSRHAKAIVDGADAGRWEEVRLELDRTQATVRQTMRELRDEQLAQFVSMGGWLRGTEAAGSVVQAQFSPARADLLHQPGLVGHFRRVVGKLDGEAAHLPVLLRMRRDLPQLEAVMERDQLDEDGVREIRELCASMVADILGTPRKGGGA